MENVVLIIHLILALCLIGVVPRRWAKIVSGVLKSSNVVRPAAIFIFAVKFPPPRS